MSGEPTETTRQPAESEPVLDRRSSRVSLAVFAGIVFWGWLVLRWINDWFGGVFVPSGQPFIPPTVFENLAGWLSSVAASLGPLGWLFAQLAGLFASIAFVVPYLPTLAGGVWLTIVLTTVCIGLGFVIAVPLSAARVYGHYSGYVSLAYTELIRGTPLLAQLFVLYYGISGLSAWFRELPAVGTGIVPAAAFWIAIIGFTLNSAAYQAEYLRGAIESVDPGQFTAGRAIGLSKIAGIRYVVLPQGLRYAIPSWTNELVYLIKYTSLAAFITVPELFERIQTIASETFRYTELFILAALFYLALVITASKVMSAVDDAVSIPGLGQARER
jgi:polar amino acid transport system permease protein